MTTATLTAPQQLYRPGERTFTATERTLLTRECGKMVRRLRQQCERALASGLDAYEDFLCEVDEKNSKILLEVLQPLGKLALPTGQLSLAHVAANEFFNAISRGLPQPDSCDPVAIAEFFDAAEQQIPPQLLTYVEEFGVVTQEDVEACERATAQGDARGYRRGHAAGHAEGYAEGHAVGRAAGLIEGIAEGARMALAEAKPDQTSQQSAPSADAELIVAALQDIVAATREPRETLVERDRADRMDRTINRPIAE